MDNIHTYKSAAFLENWQELAYQVIAAKVTWPFVSPSLIWTQKGDFIPRIF